VLGPPIQEEAVARRSLKRARVSRTGSCRPKPCQKETRKKAMRTPRLSTTLDPRLGLHHKSSSPALMPFPTQMTNRKSSGHNPELYPHLVATLDCPHNASNRTHSTRLTTCWCPATTLITTRHYGQACPRFFLPPPPFGVFQNRASLAPHLPHRHDSIQPHCTWCQSRLPWAMYRKSHLLPAPPVFAAPRINPSGKRAHRLRPPLEVAARTAELSRRHARQVP